MDAANIIDIALDRGPCFGFCPPFHFTAFRHAGYRYQGRGYVEPLGERAGGLPGYLFDRLAEACIELRVLELDDVYPCHFEDAPSVTITVRHTFGVKVVRNEGGDSGPVRLWAFAASLKRSCGKRLNLSVASDPNKQREEQRQQ